jgi:hypothetical protein
VEMRKATVCKEMVTGPEFVDGECYGALAITPSSNLRKYGYTITHIPSGLSVGAFPTKKNARKAIQEMLSIAEWEKVRPGRKLPAAQMRRLGMIYKNTGEREEQAEKLTSQPRERKGKKECRK